MFQRMGIPLNFYADLTTHRMLRDPYVHSLQGLSVSQLSAGAPSIDPLKEAELVYEEARALREALAILDEAEASLPSRNLSRNLTTYPGEEGDIPSYQETISEIESGLCALNKRIQELTAFYQEHTPND
jgi:hypothetical protein